MSCVTGGQCHHCAARGHGPTDERLPQTVVLNPGGHTLDEWRHRSFTRNPRPLQLPEHANDSDVLGQLDDSFAAVCEGSPSSSTCIAIACPFDPGGGVRLERRPSVQSGSRVVMVPKPCTSRPRKRPPEPQGPARQSTPEPGRVRMSEHDDKAHPLSGRDLSSTGTTSRASAENLFRPEYPRKKTFLLDAGRLLAVLVPG